MIVKNLRASQGRLKAEVVVGQNPLGGNVVLIVDVDRRRKDVQDAMATFENLLLREAQAQIKGSANRAEIDSLAKARADELVKAADARSQRIVKQALLDIRGSVERVIQMYSRTTEEGTSTVTVAAVKSVVTSINQQIERQSA